MVDDGGYLKFVAFMTWIKPASHKREIVWNSPAGLSAAAHESRGLKTTS